MNKQEIDEMTFFRNINGEIQYHGKCLNCTEDCKQSYRAELVQCLDYCDRNLVSRQKATSTENN